MSTDPLDLLVHDEAAGLTVVRDGDVAIITYDQPESPVNTLNSRLGAAFTQLFIRLETDASLVGAVLLSGKADSWVAGADIA